MNFDSIDHSSGLSWSYLGMLILLNSIYHGELFSYRLIYLAIMSWFNGLLSSRGATRDGRRGTTRGGDWCRGLLA